MGATRLSAVAAVVVLSALALAAGAQACSCAQVPPKAALRSADAAIVGELVAVVPRAGQRADYRYRVQRVYKQGAGLRRGRTVSVRSARTSAACGLPLGTGHRYGVLLAWDEGRWTSGRCGVLRPDLLRDCAS